MRSKPDVLSSTGWTLGDLAAAGALRWPNALALVDGDLQLTFQELEQAAQALARQFQLRGLRHGDRVLIAGPHSATYVVAILATGLLGAVFVPVDPSLPLTRLQLLVADARPRLVLAPDSLCDHLPALLYDRLMPWQTAETCVTSSTAARQTEVRSERSRAPHDVAYMIYTSGSTGRPKGVQIEHRALVAFFETYNAAVGLQPGDRCLNTGAFHFDVCLLDVFLPLYFGATVYLRASLPLGSLLLKQLAAHRITHIYTVGTLLAQITADGTPLDRCDLSALKVLQTGAEVCNSSVVNHWLRRLPTLRFIHSYGPTEVTVGCIQYAKPELGPLSEPRCPIGTPHRDTAVVLIDAHGRPIHESWSIGELWLGGAQLMRGYWNAPVTTNRAFVELDGEWYYRSGDMAYRDDAGLYWFVGRNDDQIKFLGHRMHLSELRNALTTHADVHSAVAEVILDEAGQQQLALVVEVARTPSADLARSLREWLRQRLPNYMVPSVIGLLVSWPTLPSGKADTRTCLEALGREARRFGRGAYVRSHERFVPLRASDCSELPRAMVNP
jgi:D-alanine--poly(phosphoribitol) ligase subunit 1